MAVTIIIAATPTNVVTLTRIRGGLHMTKHDPPCFARRSRFIPCGLSLVLVGVCSLVGVVASQVFALLLHRVNRAAFCTTRCPP